MPGKTPDADSERPDQVWSAGDSPDAAPTFYLPFRSDPYLVQIGDKYLRVHVLMAGTVPPATGSTDTALAAALEPIVPKAGAKRRGER